MNRLKMLKQLRDKEASDLTDNKRIMGMLGIAAKAGRLKSGEFQSEESVKSGRARLCILASDASERTSKHFRDMCEYRHIPVYKADIGKDALGQTIGRGQRTSVTIEDKGLADNILRLIDGGSVSGNRE
jgi:ribosomal protein L7Ae-like RNA K-turn-binding protein